MIDGTEYPLEKKNFNLNSGYIGYTEGTPRLRIHSYLSLWLEVVFYSLLPYVFLMFLSPGAASWKDLLKAFFPITTDAYWYFTAYTGLFFLIPLLNAGIRGCSNGQLMGLCLILCAVFTIRKRFHFKTNYVCNHL